MSLRQQLLIQIAHDLYHEPYQPSYHKKPYGKLVTGWGDKLSSYFWPKPETNYAATFTLMDPWFTEAGQAISTSFR